MKILRRCLKSVDLFSERVAKIFAWLTVILIIGMVYSTILRYIFGKPPLWTYDFVYYSANVCFMMGAAYVLHIKRNVAIDLFYQRLPTRGQAITNIVCSLLFFFPLLLALLYFSMINVPFAWQAGERAVESVIRVPIYPLKTVIPITCLLLLFQGVAEFIRWVHLAISGTERELEWK